MKRLEEIKNEIAIKHHYGYWVDLVSQNDMLTIDKYHNEAIHQYAREVAQASLQKAAENAKITKEACGNSMECGCMGNCEYPLSSINKRSITNESNITLL